MKLNNLLKRELAVFGLVFLTTTGGFTVGRYQGKRSGEEATSRKYEETIKHCEELVDYFSLLLERQNNKTPQTSPKPRSYKVH